VDKEQWLHSLNGNGGVVSKFIDDILRLSAETDNERFFSTCGLYAIGSSLKPESSDDVDLDITLVGLDFRAVFKYGWIYLQDPETLIASEIVVPDDSHSTSFGEHNRLSHDGKEYSFNPEKVGSYDHIETYTSSDITFSPFVFSLLESLCKMQAGNLVVSDDPNNGDLNPLMAYNSSHGDFLGSRFSFEPIDFFIHGENLFVRYWKEHQRSKDLPFVVLHEWRNAQTEDMQIRRDPVGLPVPDFIDIYGKERSKFVPGQSGMGF